MLSFVWWLIVVVLFATDCCCLLLVCGLLVAMEEAIRCARGRFHGCGLLPCLWLVGLFDVVLCVFHHHRYGCLCLAGTFCTSADKHFRTAAAKMLGTKKSAGFVTGLPTTQNQTPCCARHKAGRQQFTGSTDLEAPCHVLNHVHAHAPPASRHEHV